MGLTPDQQRRCDDIVERALALDTRERSKFAAEACGDDTELRCEVDALLGDQSGLTAIFGISPAARLAPPKFGRYQTERLIGSGGMSMVYRALDPVIKR